MLRETVLLLLVTIGCNFALPRQTRQAAARCGYQACPAVDPTKINIHLIPHSHDDLGYLKTFDQTYYGTRNDISNVGVQYILDSVIDALEDNEDRKFVFAETAYFWKWWSEQNEETQLLVKTLVNEGRLEFVGGAWSQNDEADTNYISIIDQFSYGLKKLTDTFGECGRPKAGWQIDTYGHSREMASILAQLGYDGLFVSRIDYQDRQRRLDTKTMELVWESSPKNLGSSAEIFMHIMSNFYGPPNGFCFDILTCDVQSFVDDNRSPDYNVDLKVREFMNYVNAHTDFYTTNNLLLTMGGDFNYQDAQAYFKNLDKLIKYVTQVHGTWTVNIMYSTPSCYLKAVNDAKLVYNTVQDDFFPYASDAHSYWTGFYSSRPTNKYFERLGNNFLQVTKQLAAMTQLGQGVTSPLDSLREAMGIMQHHHAITGTEKQNVADDYIRILTNGIEDARVAANDALNLLMAVGTETAEFVNCLSLNVSMCAASENEQFVVTVYNPLSHAVNAPVRFPVVEGTYLVQDPNGVGQTVQFLPVAENLLRVPEREGSLSFYELVFMATNLPPLGFKSYHVNKISTDFLPVNPTTDTSTGDENLQVILDDVTGLVSTIVSKGIEMPVSQNFYYYEALNGNDLIPGNRSSGSYVFHPTKQEVTPIAESVRVDVYRGDVVDEIHQIFTTWLRQIIRVYKGEDNIEFDWIVGPVPVDDGVGKEIISRFTTDFRTDGLFYTDSNGREMMERRINYRPSWLLENNEPIAGNYYPVTSKIVIKDERMAQQFSVLTDRAQGGSSLDEGQVELMIHRRLVEDDGLGVGEALNELAFSAGLMVRGKHYVMTGSNNVDSPSFAAQERELAQKKLLAPWLFFSPTTYDFVDWQSRFTMEFSGLTQDLPANVLLHTLEPWGEDSLLLRLEHILESDEDTELSQPATVEFEDIFTTFTVTDYQEKTLDGNLAIADVQRLVWNSTFSSTATVSQRDMTLSPMQISTHVLTVARK